MRELDNLAARLLCDLAHVVDQRGWKLVDLLTVARARYGLEIDDRGEQLDGFELVPPQYESRKKTVQSAGADEDDEQRRAS